VSDIESRRLTLGERALVKPQELRAAIREGRWKPDETSTQYYCRGYIQLNLVIVPKDVAFEFLVFCLRNPRNCFVAEVCDAGSPHPKHLAPSADLRTDLHKYRVFKEGKIVDEPHDISSYWRDDLVSFLLGCSMGFEGVFRDKNISWRTMGTYTCDIECVTSGCFQCDRMTVSCRLFPDSLSAVRAIQITSQLPISHGYPIHIGDPSEIGIDLMKPDIWNPYPSDSPPEAPKPNEICMAWGCGVTPQLAIAKAKPSLAITHYSPYMFVSDGRVEEFHSSFRT
jgi:uncharacterized protein YcsI (UPF0317 family)